MFNDCFIKFKHIHVESCENYIFQLFVERCIKDFLMLSRKAGALHNYDWYVLALFGVLKDLPFFFRGGSGTPARCALLPDRGIGSVGASISFSPCIRTCIPCTLTTGKNE
jgi:hypothetical protein